MDVDDKAGLGDKVRVKNGEHKGARGRVDDVVVDGVVVYLDTGDRVVLAESDVTNFSLAARRAWRVMPSRAVGRPKSPEAGRKKSVSLRIDIDVWRQLGEAVELGL